MQPVKNERGYIIVFVTLMITLLLIMVGMGLDTGHLSYVRSQGQPAVDAAALAAAAAIPSNKWSIVTEQAAKFNPGGTNPGPGNDYVDSPNNEISHQNVTLVNYNEVTGEITTGVNIKDANGARVALENKNPYGGTAGEAIEAPLFLTPLFNLFGQTVSNSANVSVSAVAVNQALPGLPIVVLNTMCGGGTVTLDFRTGGSGTAGWETYYIDNASTSEVRELWRALPYCAGQPLVDKGYCGNVANGVNETIVNETLKPMFAANPNDCYLVPVVKQGGNFNQCQTITDWASFCPDRTNPFPETGKLKGTVTCGQSIYHSRDTKCYVQTLVRDKTSGM